VIKKKKKKKISLFGKKADISFREGLPHKRYSSHAHALKRTRKEKSFARTIEATRKKIYTHTHTR